MGAPALHVLHDVLSAEVM